ncbi:helix-turn-helix domain-containing protein [Wenxinia saemankumensis]|uniref:Transcriptional regulator, XRE family with cupin sensor n=1 Tax=Wenxinia saemankumensis TaxID=1447782 RepID=A0A1M6FMX2_9RHOB|nr:cupin domain-containing protein [Wenxinia saemankumensis]SHI99037.1 transcriptional regulator, XRE family with cupin sensor [Wenxinia saemankumensis]
MDTAPSLGPQIRRRRKRMDLTLQALCDRAGLSVGYLSQVERDQATPTLATLAQIARALGVDLDFFVAARRPGDALTRDGARPRFHLAGSVLGYESLANDYPGSELSSYIIHVPPGYASERVAHAGEEVIYILDGEIDQQLGAETFRLSAGDSLHYDGAVPHGWANPGDAPARILWTGKLDVLHRPEGPASPPFAAAET